MRVYLDNGATSFPKPECVYEAINYFMRNVGASPGRGNYAKAMESEQLVYDARKAIARLFNVKRPGEIVFTANVTESINLVLKGFLNDGDKVLTSNVEHNAMWRPLKNLEHMRNISIEQFHCSKNGDVDLQEIREKLSNNVKLLAFVHGSNVLGNIMPLLEIMEIAHEYGVPVLIDTAQTAGAYPIDVQQLDVDFIAFTGHKSMLGPTGTGGLYIKEGLELATFKEGGTGSMAKSPFQPIHPPDRFEAGTMNIFGLAGLKASVEFLLDTKVKHIYEHEQKLAKQLIEGLQTYEEISIYGSKSSDCRLGLISFNIFGMNPYDVALRLDEEFGIMVRAGLHCAPRAHELLGTGETGAVRVSTSFFNTEEHIEIFLSAIGKILK